MTIVNVTIDKTKKIKRVLVSGHSNYDVLGRDIVCASVSVAMYMSANLISKVLNSKEFNFQENKKNTTMDLLIKKDNEFVDIIMENLIYTLKSISDDYADYLQIKINE